MHFCSKVVHCGIWDGCIVGFVNLVPLCSNTKSCVRWWRWILWDRLRRRRQTNHTILPRSSSPYLSHIHIPLVSREPRGHRRGDSGGLLQETSQSERVGYFTLEVPRDFARSRRLYSVMSSSPFKLWSFIFKVNSSVSVVCIMTAGD